MLSDSQEESSTRIDQLPLRNRSLDGTTLSGRYLIKNELKRGGFGVVYLARDKQLHSRPVVVKVLLEDAYENEYVTQKFRQEIEALSRIDHPGVVGIIDSGHLPNGKPFIVMQYVDGVTLRSVMTAEGMDFERAADLIKQMGRALTAAHEKGILHRDLKPENVMLQNLGHGEEQVKIIDFGIAKLKDSVVAASTSTNVAIGTVAYMAPEQLSHRPVSAASDVYALGQVAYEMLTGRRPFNPETAFELLEMQRAGVRINPVDLRPSLPSHAAALVLKALSFDPSNRQSRAREFGDELARSLGEASLNSETIQRGAGDPLPTKLVSELTPLAQNVVAQSQKTIPVSFPLVQPSDRGLPDLDVQNTKSHTNRLPAFLAIGLVLLVGVSVAVWYFFPGRATTAVTNPTSSTRNLNYSLTVQKMRNGLPYQDQFESSGREIFENGWKFRLNLSSPQPGYLYLLNEGPTAGGVNTFALLFPTPLLSQSNAFVDANAPVTTGWMVFDENQGTEKFWLVWSSAAVPELEAVKGVVNDRDKGTISDSSQARAVQAFLSEKRGASQAQTEKDVNKKQSIVKGNGDVLVNAIELEHH